MTVIILHLDIFYFMEINIILFSLFFLFYRRWAPKTFSGAPKKDLAHRALDDIKESIQELKYYKSNFCKIEC